MIICNNIVSYLIFSAEQWKSKIHHLLSSTRETIRQQETMSGIIMTARNASKCGSLFSPTRAQRKTFKFICQRPEGKHILFAGCEASNPTHTLPFKALGSVRGFHKNMKQHNSEECMKSMISEGSCGGMMLKISFLVFWRYRYFKLW